MARETRAGTRGNAPVDLTALRANIENVNPVVQSTLRNAVPTNGRSNNHDEMGGKNTINPYKLTKLSNIISNNINAAVDLRAITPYIDKAELIWSTIMLSPNGKQDNILTYDTRPSKIKNAKMHSELLQLWRDYYTNDYKIEPELRPMLSDIFWNTGSYVLFNLSRPGLDYLINGSEMQDRAGNEHFQAKARAAISEEFVKVGNKYLAKNLGKFVRDPHATGATKSVSGLESILSNPQPYSGVEFDLFSNEEYKENTFNITFTDNLSLLYLQKLNAHRRVEDVNKIMGVENMDLIIQKATGKGSKEEKKETPQKPPKSPKATTQNLTETEVNNLGNRLFPGRNPAHQSIQFVKSDSALKVQTYGRGLVWHVPSEAVIPVHRRGRTGMRDDYIFLLDDEGEFLKSTADPEFYQGKKPASDNNTQRPKGGSVNSLITNLKTIQEGKDCEFDMSEFAEMSNASIIRQFMGAVISGTSDNISISIDEETNKIFLARMFKGQSIRCLYVPGECVTYMAFKFNSLGVGQSLTQAAKTHIARLAAYDVADAMANLEAAQPHTQMAINIAKEDPDPMRTIAIARATHFEANPRLHNILSASQLSIPQIVDALREASLTIKINAGENTHIPAPDIELNHMDKQNFKPVDPSSRDEVLNKISNYFGLPRSWLDVVDGGENNFQIEALTEHQMLMNQGALYQDQFADHLIDFERKHAYVNGPLLESLVTVIADNKALWVSDSKEQLEGDEPTKIKLILADFFNSLYCTLPVPSSTENINKLKDKLEAIDALVTSWGDLSGYDKMMPTIAKTLGLEEGAYNAEEIKAAVKAAFVTEAFKRFNLPMPFDEIVSEGKGGGMASLVNAIVYQRANIGEFLAKFTVDVAKEDKKMIKSHAKKIAAALAALAEVTGDDDDENADNLGGDGENTDDPLLPGLDDEPVPGTDPLEGGGGGEEEEEESEEEEEEETPPESEDTPPVDKDAGPNDGTDPALNNPKEDPFGGKK